MAAVKKGQMTPIFSYEGVDRKGAKIKGELPARNMALAKVNLRKQGITIKTIREKKKNLANNRVLWKPCWIVSQFIKKKVSC